MKTWFYLSKNEIKRYEKKNINYQYILINIIIVEFIIDIMYLGLMVF